MKSFHIKLSDDLHRKIKIESQVSGISITKLIESKLSGSENDFQELDEKSLQTLLKRTFKGWRDTEDVESKRDAIRPFFPEEFLIFFIESLTRIDLRVDSMRRRGVSIGELMPIDSKIDEEVKKNLERFFREK